MALNGLFIYFNSTYFILCFVCTRHCCVKNYVFYFFTLFVAVYDHLSAQEVYQPYLYQFYQKLNTTIYSKSTRIHSSLKPMFADDSLIASAYQALMNQGVDTGRHQSLFCKLFNEHLVDVKAGILILLGRPFLTFPRRETTPIKNLYPDYK